MEAASFYGMKWNKRYSEQPAAAETLVEAGPCPNKKPVKITQDGFWFCIESVIMQAS